MDSRSSKAFVTPTFPRANRQILYIIFCHSQDRYRLQASSAASFLMTIIVKINTGTRLPLVVYRQAILVRRGLPGAAVRLSRTSSL